MKLTYTMMALAATTLAADAVITVGGEIDNSYAGLFSRYTAASLDDTNNNWVSVSTSAVRTLGNDQGNVTVQAGGAALNNQNYVDFDGESSIWGGYDVTGGQYSVSFVLRIDADTNGYVFDGTTTGQRGALFAGSGSNETEWTMFSNQAGSGSSIVGTDFTIGEWQIHTVVYDDGVVGGSKHYINGELAYSGTLDNVGTFQSMIVGARVNNAQKLNGGIAEIMIHDEALSNADILDVQGALSTTYGITIVPEPSSAALLGLGGLALILRRRK